VRTGVGPAGAGAPPRSDGARRPGRMGRAGPVGWDAGPVGWDAGPVGWDAPARERVSEAYSSRDVWYAAHAAAP
jgi:hypothetical protein